MAIRDPVLPRPVAPAAVSFHSFCATAMRREGAGANFAETLAFASAIRYPTPRAGLAQLVEQRFCKPKVGGSSPSTGTMLKSHREDKRLKTLNK